MPTRWRPEWSSDSTWRDHRRFVRITGTACSIDSVLRSDWWSTTNEVRCAIARWPSNGSRRGWPVPFESSEPGVPLGLPKGRWNGDSMPREGSRLASAIASLDLTTEVGREPHEIAPPTDADRGALDGQPALRALRTGCAQALSKSPLISRVSRSGCTRSSRTELAWRSCP